MCGAILSAFRLAGHVRQSPHLGAEAAVLLDPWRPERIHKLARANTGLSERSTTGERRRWRAKSWHRIRCCVGVWIDIRLLFPPKTKPQRDGCQLVGGLMGVALEGWRVRDRKTDASGQGCMKTRDLTECVYFVFFGRASIQGILGKIDEIYSDRGCPFLKV